MPFKKYKAAHGGHGPLEDLYAAATGGVGLFGRLGLRHERELTDQLIADVSSSDEFRGLSAMAEAGRAPMTREEHAQFRAGVMQAALDTRVFNAGMKEYGTRTARAREQAVSKEDLLLLDNFDAMAGHAQRLAESGNGAKAQEVFGTVLANFGAYVQRNEEQRLELESSEAAGRETIRKELQGQINSMIVGPAIENTSMYNTIRAQLEGPSGEEVAPPSLVSAVLDYSGAALRQSDDGNWTFSIGPLGVSDTNLPAMTYSQIRNRLEQAYQGHDRSLRASAAPILDLAQKRGFAVNGTGVDDLMFPLANQEYRRREAESRPPSVTSPEGAHNLSQQITDKLGNFGRGFMPNITGWATDAAEALFGSGSKEPDVSRGDDYPGNKRRGPGSVSGIIRRPVND